MYQLQPRRVVHVLPDLRAYITQRDVLIEQVTKHLQRLLCRLRAKLGNKKPLYIVEL